MGSASELLTSPARNGDQYTVMQVDKSVLCQVAGHESILHSLTPLVELVELIVWPRSVEPLAL